MGIGGIGIWQLLIILVIVLLLFGTKRLRGLGGDLGGAIKGFKKAIGEENPEKPEGEEELDADGNPKKVTGEPVAGAKPESVDQESVKSETKQ